MQQRQLKRKIRIKRKRQSKLQNVEKCIPKAERKKVQPETYTVTVTHTLAQKHKFICSYSYTHIHTY